MRTLPGEAAPRGFGTPLLLALRSAPVDEGRFNVFYLPEDAALPTLAAPVRVAAAGITGDAGEDSVLGPVCLLCILTVYVIWK